MIYATRLRLSADSGVAEPILFGLFSIKAYAVGWHTHQIGISIMVLGVNSSAGCWAPWATGNGPDRDAPCCGHTGELSVTDPD
jgi:hypothetical protein